MYKLSLLALQMETDENPDEHQHHDEEVLEQQALEQGQSEGNGQHDKEEEAEQSVQEQAQVHSFHRHTS